jgi:hypothetical protein
MGQEIETMYPNFQANNYTKISIQFYCISTLNHDVDCQHLKDRAYEES